MRQQNDIDKYINGFPADVRKILEQLRMTIKKTAPDAEEVLSYKMPAYKLSGMIAWFAAHKNHIGFYPTSTPIKIFKEELKKIKTSKGAIQFPIGKRLPIRLITKIIKFKIEENLSKSNKKKKK